MEEFGECIFKKKLVGVIYLEVWEIVEMYCDFGYMIVIVLLVIKYQIELVV